ncbi:hypothetical protein D9M69_562570 [compost metagenome]
MSSRHIINEEPVIFFKDDFFAVGRHRRPADRRRKLRQSRFYPLIKGIQVIFPVFFIGNKIDNAVFVYGRVQIFAVIGGVLRILTGFGMVAQEVGVIFTPVPFPVHLAVAFHGIRENVFA